MNAIGTLSGEETRGEVGELSGYWQGTLDVGAAKLRLVLRISDDGRVIVHSLDQGGQGLPADRTLYEDGRFRAVSPAPGAGTANCPSSDPKPCRGASDWRSAFVSPIPRQGAGPLWSSRPRPRSVDKERPFGAEGGPAP